MLTLKNVSMYYHSGQIVTVGLSDISLTLKKGEFVGITGASGSGKSTLLSIISMLIPYQEGEILYEGQPSSFFDDRDREDYRRNHIGIIFQNYNLMDSYTVLQNVESAILVTGVTKREARNKSLEILRQVGMEHLKDKRAAKLSSGQKQRVSIARALAKNPEIIIADEPTGNLDSENGKQIMKLLKELSKDRLVIMATHNLEEASDYITRRVQLQDGKVTADIQMKSQRDHSNTEQDQYEGQKQSIKPASDSNVKKQEAMISLRFAILNMKAQPKKSILIFVFMLFTSLSSFFFLGSILSNMDDTWAKYYDNSAFLNGDRTRIVVWKTDNSPMTKEDLSNFYSMKYVREADLYDFTNDCNYYCEYDEDYYYKYRTIEVMHKGELLGAFEERYPLFLKHNKFMRSSTCLSEENLVSGRLPRSANEIVLYTRDHFLLESNKTFYFSNLNDWGEGHYVTMDMTIVGILAEATSQVYFSEQMSLAMNANNNDRNSDLVYNYIDLNKEKELRYFTAFVFVDDSLTSIDEIVVSKNIVKHMESVEDKMTLYHYFSEQDFTERIVTAVGEKQDSSKQVIKISQELFETMYSDVVSRQASLYIEDYVYTDDVLKELKEAGYEAVSPFRIGSLTYNSTKVQERLFTLFLSTTSFICVFILEIMVLSAFLHFKRKDFQILTSIGANSKMVRLMNRYELAIHEAIALVACFLIVLIMKMNQVSYSNRIFLYYRYYHYFILLFVNLITTGLLILKCNHSMVKRSKKHRK